MIKDISNELAELIRTELAIPCYENYAPNNTDNKLITIIRTGEVTGSDYSTCSQLIEQKFEYITFSNDERNMQDLQTISDNISELLRNISNKLIGDVKLLRIVQSSSSYSGIDQKGNLVYTNRFSLQYEINL